jgi:sugar lactone lactonase YvrE
VASMSAAHAVSSRFAPRPIHVDADPNGVAFGHHDESLYVADAKSGAIFRVEAGRQRRLATIDLECGTGKCRVGGLAVTPQGALYATRLGDGVGGVFRIEPDLSTEALEGLSVDAWRVGLTYDASTHALYVTQYEKAPGGPFDGAVAKIDLASGDSTMIVTGLRKPVGIAKLGDALVITDANARVVYRVDLDGDREVSRTALASRIDRPDSCVVAGHDSVLVTTYDDASELGAVRQIRLDGSMRTIAVGPWEPRGITTDYDRVYVSARRGERILVFTL